MKDVIGLQNATMQIQAALGPILIGIVLVGAVLIVALLLTRKGY